MAPGILMIAGGGGHTGHAYTVSQFLRGRARLGYIIPRGDRFSRGKLEGFGEVYEVYKPVSPTSSYLSSMHRFIPAVIDSLKTPIKMYDVVVCYGSNHCIAPSLVSKLLHGKPLVLVESPVRIVTPSKAIRMLNSFADYVFVSWREQKRLYRKTIVVGPFYEAPKYKPYHGGYILVVTGTYGFPELVEAVLKLPVEKAVVQTGRDDPEKYRKIKPGWVFFDFDPDLGHWIAGAELVISHFGRTPVDAALGYGKPVVIVPNPRWIHAASLMDAYYLSRKINAVLLPSPDRLDPELLRKILNNPPVPSKMINGAKILAEALIKIASRE